MSQSGASASFFFKQMAKNTSEKTKNLKRLQLSENTRTFAETEI
jgi:hypothetical protein